MKRKPWGDSHGFSDTTRRRVEVRVAFLGLSHAALGERIGQIDEADPLSGGTVRAYIAGRRAWRRGEHGDRVARPQPIERFAAALGVPVAALEPGGPWEPLVRLETAGVA